MDVWWWCEVTAKTETRKQAKKIDYLADEGRWPSFDSFFSLFFPSLQAMVNTVHDVKIAVIGGSGLYNLEGLEVIEEVNPETVSR